MMASFGLLGVIVPVLMELAPPFGEIAFAATSSGFAVSNAAYSAMIMSLSTWDTPVQVIETVFAPPLIFFA